MTTRVYLFEGAPGAGKSTLSEFAAEQLELSGVTTTWLEEHVLDSTQFREFGRALKEGPDGARPALLADWDRLIAQTQGSDRVFFLDGAYFGNTLKFLFARGGASRG